MNTTTLPQSPLTEYQARARATRRRRQAAGKYATPSQKQAFSRMLQVGKCGLTKAELAAMATHPHLLPRQRAEYATLAAAAEIDGDGCIANMPTSNAA